MLEYTPSPADQEISLKATLGAIVALALAAWTLEFAGFERATLAVLGLGVFVSAGLTTWHLVRFRRFRREHAN